MTTTIRLLGQSVTLTLSWREFVHRLHGGRFWREFVHRLHGGRFCRFGWHDRSVLGQDRVCLWCLDSRPK